MWVLEYTSFDPRQERLRESLCTLGNGFFGTRGAAEEARADECHYPATYLAGGYNRLETSIAGRIVENEDLVNLPNWLCLTFRFGDGAWFDLSEVEVLDFRQTLDCREGTLSRAVRFRDRQGVEARLHSLRCVHMAEPHLAGLQLTLTTENWSGRAQVRSAIDGRVVNAGVPRYRALNGRHLEPEETRRVGEHGICLVAAFTQSRLRVAEAARTDVFGAEGQVAAERQTVEEPGWICQDIAFDLQRDRPVRVEKVCALYTSRDRAIAEPALEAATAIRRAPCFERLLETHRTAWRQLWAHCDMVLTQDARAQQLLRLHIFHLLQTVSHNTIDLDAGVPARGLHGEAYRGHIFWDELFIFPFFNFRIPQLTRTLLLYRYRRLPEARETARRAGGRGAIFPWQSGSNGREESQVVHLNPRSGRWVPDRSHLQRHVNAAIAYNVWHYYQATRDLDFLSFYGAELMIEIARGLAGLSTYDAARDRYEIRHVMGPDEFHDGYPGAEEGGLHNNAYTNVMTVWVLDRTLEALEVVGDDRRRELMESLELEDQELTVWRDIAHKMRIVFHDEGIISQFEGYADLEEFDWEGYRRRYGDIHRLDRILESEGDTVNRYKASKQADVLMLFYLLSIEELRAIFERLGYPFDGETIVRNIRYYMDRTSHGSTLSGVVHAWVLARSDRARSWSLLAHALESDVSDVQGGTTEEGVHLGAMAGTVDLVQRAYGGLETEGDVLRINPRLPEPVKSLSLRFRYRGHWFEMLVTQERLRLKCLRSGAAPATVRVDGEDVVFEPGQVREFTLPGAAD